MSDLTDRITVNPKQCGGRPCIRGMRVTAGTIVAIETTSTGGAGVRVRIDNHSR